MSNVILDGLCFGEGQGGVMATLMSDMHDQKVLRVALSGTFDVVVQLADDQPSGLGWLPNGDLLIVAMSSRRLLRFDGTEISVHADLSELASGICNDMVVDSAGRAYVGNFGFDLHRGAAQRTAELIQLNQTARRAVLTTSHCFPMALSSLRTRPP